MYRLHQFVSSHFNEKARWALDYKGLEHQRINYLPGPHRRAMVKLSGQPATPVLQTGDNVIAGSAAIIDHLEQQHPAPALYPEDLSLRRQALDLAEHWDKVTGPAVRTAAFSVFVDEPGYLAMTFSSGKAVLKRIGYRLMIPLVLPVIRNANGVNPENVERSLRLTEQALDQVAEQARTTGYLVGDQFSVADLTAASLLAPIASVKHPDMRRQEPQPDKLRVLLQRWSNHDAITWVNRMYDLHRQQPGRN